MILNTTASAFCWVNEKEFDSFAMGWSKFHVAILRADSSPCLSRHYPTQTVIDGLGGQSRWSMKTQTTCPSKQKIVWMFTTRRPASTGIFFAQLQIFWSTFANNKNWYYCFEFSFQRFSTNINATTDFYISCKKGGYHDFLLNFFCLAVKIRCSRKFSVWKNFMHKRGEEVVSPFSVDNVLFHKTEKLRRVTLLCFRKFLVLKNFMDKRGEEGVSRLYVKNFASHSTKKFCGEPFLLSEKFWYQNFSCIRKGAVSRFSVVILKLKIVGKGWDSNPYLPLQIPVVLPTVPWEPLEFLTNVGEIKKKQLAQKRLEPRPNCSELCFPTHCAMGTIQISEKFSQVINIFGPTETWIWTYRIKTLFSQTHLCHFFLNKKSWQFWTEKKGKTTLLNELILHIINAAKKIQGKMQIPDSLSSAMFCFIKLEPQKFPPKL